MRIDIPYNAFTIPYEKKKSSSYQNHLFQTFVSLPRFFFSSYVYLSARFISYSLLSLPHHPSLFLSCFPSLFSLGTKKTKSQHKKKKPGKSNNMEKQNVATDKSFPAKFSFTLREVFGDYGMPGMVPVQNLERVQ